MHVGMYLDAFCLERKEKKITAKIILHSKEKSLDRLISLSARQKVAEQEIDTLTRPTMPWLSSKSNCIFAITFLNVDRFEWKLHHRIC